MARPREHDQTEVREAIMRGFWESGFAASTMSRLQESTGIDKRQLTRDFGSKKGLFLQAISDYEQVLDDQVLARLNAESATTETIRSVLLYIVEFSKHPDGQFGCLICNTSVDGMAMTDDDISEAISAAISRVEAAYANALRNANRLEKLLLTRKQIRMLSRSFLAAQISIMLLMRLGAETAVLRDIAEQALAALETGG